MTDGGVDGTGAGRGVLLMKGERNYDQAIKDHSKAIELNPQDVSAYNNRALACEQFEQTAKAEADHQK